MRILASALWRFPPCWPSVHFRRPRRLGIVIIAMAFITTKTIITATGTGVTVAA